MSLRPNPPRMVTVLAAIALLVIGLSLEGSVVSVPQLNAMVTDFLRQVDLPFGREVLARFAIVAAPALLVVGSLLPGI